MFSSPLRLRRTLTRSLLIGTCTCLGVVVGLPFVSVNGINLSWAGQPVQAQVTKQDNAFDLTEIRNFAKSVLDLEVLRQRWATQVSNELNVETLPAIACNDPNSIRDISRDARQMVVEFCQESIMIVEGHDLSVSRFNAITQAMASNPDLQERVTEELLDLQRGS